MKRLILLLLIAISFSCTYTSTEPTKSTEQTIPRVAWSKVDTIDITAFNKDLEEGKPTLDIGVYFPSNFDTAFKKVTLARMLESIRSAKEIYKPTGVQINLLWVKTGELNPRYFSIQANEVPSIPDTEYTNMYVHARRHPSLLTEHAREAFTSIIEPDEQNSRTIYLIALQDVFFPFLEVSEGRNWAMKTVRTGGLSFPTYSYVNTLPDALRGIITITNLSRPDRYRITVAHEIGHKAMNVSHEYMSTNPGHEIYADGGLMLYGNGEDIPSGKEGRWHLERLHLSPFIYRLQNGTKVWNDDYKEGGHYYDPIYGDKVIYFGGKAEIDENW
ncbi:MAG: ImmA/IrrE family metallo-endopeptidase [Flammeovirgaceae bacterium]|nr:ImmA/IrrE family metallo-endopeptidase [Flammeovirgaceae bacterium]